MRYRLSADVGGTFTDVVRLDALDGSCMTAKVPTTLANLAEGIVAGFDRVTGGDYSEVIDIVHGTTNGLNSLIERRGAATAVITTRGFRDIAEIGRGNHPDMYDVRYRKPVPLVERKDVFEVAERIRTDGSVELGLDPEEVVALAERIDGRYESLAICLLNSFANPAHEAAVRSIVEARLTSPMAVTISSEISAESREYERFSTAILNAYIAPSMRRYLTTLQGLLHDRGFGGRLAIMNSNGGLMSVASAMLHPARTLMSGPVGGVIGAAAVGAELGAGDVIAIDMGGTSFDVSMLSGGALDISLDTAVEGVPVMVPTVNTLSVGAGGGSIAWTEADAMRVGPQSSGAVPGPICYSRGGTQPTVTDANLILGRIDPERFLGGGMRLDSAAALGAFESYGAAHGLGALEAAEGVLEIANSKMADAIREITLWRGKDVRDFTLLAYGGAGPMHAALIAEQLDVSRVVIPLEPGAFSAWGMLHADLRHDLTKPLLRRLDEMRADELAAAVAELQGRLLELLAADGRDETPVFGHTLDLRYVGQEYSIGVELDGGFDPGEVRSTFETKYRELYGFSSSGADVELLSVRTTASIAERWRPVLQRIRAGSDGAPLGVITAHFGGIRHAMPVHQRELLPDTPIAGPAVIVELTSTAVLPVDWELRIDATGALILTRIAER